MSWHWRPLTSCDLDGLMDDVNPQMKTLEGALRGSRPAVMSGYPEAQGAVVDQTSVSHAGDTTETTLKTFDFGRGAIGSKGGFKVHAAGQCDGATSTKNIKLKWGGETICTLNVQAGDSKQWSIFAQFFNVNTTQDQRYLVHAWDGLTLETMAVGIISVDTL